MQFFKVQRNRLQRQNCIKHIETLVSSGKTHAKNHCSCSNFWHRLCAPTKVNLWWQEQGRYNFLKGDNREYIELWTTFSGQLSHKMISMYTRPANLHIPHGRLSIILVDIFDLFGSWTLHISDGYITNNSGTWINMRNIGTFQVYALVDNMFRTEHYKSAHIANKQALNSIYICLKKFRDQYFKSDWNKKLRRKNRKLRTVNTHPISVNGSINPSTCGCTKVFCVLNMQSRSSFKGTSGLGKDFESSY